MKTTRVDGIKLTIQGQEFVLTLEEAKELRESLANLFLQETIDPYFYRQIVHDPIYPTYTITCTSKEARATT